MGSILYIPSHNVPGFAVFFLNSPAPVGLWPSLFPIALWVPSQGGAVDLVVAFRVSFPDFKVNTVSH